MMVNSAQVASYFQNPENIHKLYVYEIVNFNNNIESVVSPNTNNFLKIKFHSVCEGIFETTQFSPQIKILNDSSDIGMRINTDYVFISNDDFDFLEKTTRSFVFTCNESYSPTAQIYFIGDNAIKGVNSDSNLDIDKIKVDSEEYSLMNIFSIPLQNIKKMEIGNNSTINFMLIEQLPNIHEIKSITYKIPLTSFVQTIQVIGDIKNKNSGLELQNEKLDLEIDPDIGIVPIQGRLMSANMRAEFEIVNFSLQKQFPLSCINKLFNETGDLFSMFNQFTDQNGHLPEFVKAIVKLFKKIICISYLYIKNFDVVNLKDDKAQAAYSTYFNNNYANKTALEYNTHLIYDWETTYPDSIDSPAYNAFKAACFALSHRIYSPFCYSPGELTNVHKSVAWVYFEYTGQDIKNMRGMFNELAQYQTKNEDAFSLSPKIKSNFFTLYKSGIENEYFTMTNIMNQISCVNFGKYLPRNSFTTPTEDYYQLVAFMKSNEASRNLVVDFSNINFWRSRQEEYNITRDTETIPTYDDYLPLLPPDAKDIEQLTNPKLTLEQVASGYGPWSGTIGTNCFFCNRMGATISLISSSATHETWQSSVCYCQKTTTKTITRKITYTSKYRYTSTFKFSTKHSTYDETYSSSSAKTYSLLLQHNGTDVNSVEFKLNRKLTDSGWYISSLREDQFFGFMNSAKQTKISYTEPESETIKEFVYELPMSFQQLDNRNTVTKNKY